MVRNWLFAIGTVVVVGFGIGFQVTATSSHEVKQERPASQVTAAPSSNESVDQRAPGDESTHTEKPGESKD